MHTDNNFPAALQVLAFLGTAMAAGILLLVTAYGLLRKKSWAKRTLALLAYGCGIYLMLLFGFSLGSHDITLARGEEKYFCEIDCHLAYSVEDTKWVTDGEHKSLAVILKTRFDAGTISSHRPKDASLTPNPREVKLIDAAGHEYRAIGMQGTSLQQPLIPGESYTTILLFSIPQETSGLRLLITAPEGPVPLLIGNEMSLGHKKTYLGL
jgi:hypothetical protein